MQHFVGLIGVAVALFASTNVDDVFILLAFLSDPKFSLRQVAVGHYIGILGLYVASVAASLISLVVAPAYVGLLGLAPIVIGLKKMWELHGRADSNERESKEPANARGGHGNIVTVAALTVANGGDNISIYTPFFAARSARDVAAMGIVFALMTALWIAAAYYLTRHRTLGAPIRRYGHRLMPFVLIALGVLILYEAGSHQLLRR
jgi:cadmium resistance protein CadD (predicted permease)